MGYDVDIAITRTATGEQRIHHDTYRGWDDLHDIQYFYDDGNFGCDCNRLLLWAGDEGTDDEDDRCSTGRYIIDAITLRDTGVIIYMETALLYPRAPKVRKVALIDAAPDHWWWDLWEEDL